MKMMGFFRRENEGEGKELVLGKMLRESADEISEEAVVVAEREGGVRIPDEMVCGVRRWMEQVLADGRWGGWGGRTCSGGRGGRG